MDKKFNLPTNASFIANHPISPLPETLNGFGSARGITDPVKGALAQRGKFI